MRTLLLSACLLFSTMLYAQNHSSPVPEGENQLDFDLDKKQRDDFSEHPPNGKISNQRMEQISHSTVNEGDRLIYDSLIWEKYNESEGKWLNYSTNRYTRDENGNTLLNEYYLYDLDKQDWEKTTKYERTFNNDNLETSYLKSTWDSNLDSWIAEEKKIFEYNDSGNWLLFEEYNWNQEYNEWEGKYKNSSSYNIAGRRIINEYYNGWNFESKSWIGQLKESYDYSDELILSLVISRWDSEVEDWGFQTKYDYQYSSQGLEESVITSYWFKDDNSWIYVEKRENSYNESNILVAKNYYKWNSLEFINFEKIDYLYGDDPDETIYTYSWIDDSWILSEKTFSNYNSEKQLINSNTYELVDNTEFWRHIQKVEYDWDKSGRVVWNQSSYWDFELDQLVYSDRMINEYNDFGSNIVYEHYKWDIENNLWIGRNAQHTLRDENNNIIDYNKYNDWDISTNSWVGEYRYTYKVNDHAKRKSSNFYNWINDDWEHTHRAKYYHHLDCSESNTPVPNYLTLIDQTELCSVDALEAPTGIGCGGDLTATTDAKFPIETVGTNVVTWTYDDGNGNTSTQKQNVIIDQSCQTLSVEDLNNLVEVYPNPSLGQINFKRKIDAIKVYNQKGQLEMQVNSPGASINVSRLKPGIYYLSLEHKSKVSRVKILKN